MLVDINICRLSAGELAILDDGRNWSAVSRHAYDHLNKNLRLASGRRYLLLGKNGCGKSTLLRAIDSGELEGWPQAVSTFLVDQDLTMDGARTVLQTVLAADTHGKAIQDEINALEDMDDGEDDEAVQRLCDLYDQLEVLGGEDEGVKAHRAERILAGLGIGDDMAAAEIGSLSGGYKMRVALACALFMSPTLLLLDEPTNHLDIPGIRWLTRYLTKDFSGTVLCVSHDRTFIEATATDVIVMSGNSLEYFHGSLAEFEQAAADSATNMERQVANLEKKKKELAQQAQQLKSQAAGKKGDQKKSSQAASRIKKLNRTGLEKTADGKKFNAQKHGIRLGANNENDGGWKNGKLSAAPLVAKEDPSVKFRFPEASLGKSDSHDVLTLRGVSFAYPDGSQQPVFTDTSVSLSAKCRVAVVGRNGSGKSTFVQLMTGALAPQKGEVWRDPHLRVALYSQHDTEALEALGDVTPLRHMMDSHPEKREQELRAHLGSFGLGGALAVQEMRTLSGGQRVRLAFAKLSVSAPHVLIMDEPTNHLDIYSIDALQDALRAFAGGVVVISHNQSLLRALDCEVLVASIKDRQMKRYEGGVEAYLERQEQLAAKREAAAAVATASNSKARSGRKV